MDREAVGTVPEMKDAAETEGARRATGVSADADGAPDPEVVAKAKRRRFSAAHGLNPDVDELMDDFFIWSGVQRDKQLKRSDLEKGEAEKRWGKCFYEFRETLERLRNVKAREAGAAPAPPRTVGVADPPSDTGRGKKWLFLGLGGAAVGGTAFYLLGKHDEAVPAAAPTPAPAPPLTPFNPAGIFDVLLTVLTDPSGNAPRIGMEQSLPLNFIVTGSTVRFTCPPGVHINPGEGPVDLITGTFNIAGSGPFAGRNGVQFLFPGTFGRDGTVTGEYRWAPPESWAR